MAKPLGLGFIQFPCNVANIIFFSVFAKRYEKIYGLAFYHCGPRNEWLQAGFLLILVMGVLFISASYDRKGRGW